MIPYGRQYICQADIDSVVEVLRSDFLTQGSMVPRFEERVAKYCGVQHAVAANSATSALHIACLALDLGPGDWLWTSPNTFVASANCAMYCGANVDFVDIDPRTYNLCPQKLSKKLQEAEKKGTLPKIVMPVHFAGQPCDMPAIFALGQKYGFKIIEDASHAIGASYNSTYVGSCSHSDITVFSFHPVKIITTGEGGLATTNDILLANRMYRLRAHGIINDKELMHPRQENEIWNYQQVELGFNYRMTDIHAALGVSQMTRLDEFVERRHEIAEYYNDQLKSLPIIAPWQAPASRSSYHLYPIRINEAQCKKNQRQLYDRFYQHGVAANLHYIPVHRQPFYERKGFSVGDFPEAERFHREVISIPIYPRLSKKSQETVVQLIKDICVI
ncbi:UDP-4-amino-4,6-dideoxy-N-acetyl-beta-L-altrosamine transaminase [Alphaproteobacteria bacterium]|nr:UDP-4-amino-4,6-dideoxy-N-acetyl-beta-L-altrosamine transaminase [Alphaproteobacteria bacterium]